MDLFGTRELQELLRVESTPCISLFAPMERVTALAHQNPVRFRNLLRQAQERLERSGVRPHTIEELLAPAQALLEDELFWLYQGDGLAVFAAPEFFRTYRVPLRLSEELAIGERFVVTPLLPLLLHNGQFWVLALEKYRIRLFLGGPSGLSEVDPAHLPSSLREALQVDQPDIVVQYRTALRVGQGRTHMATHGHGFGREDIKRMVLEYYRVVDRAFRELAAEHPFPLVLAGVEYLVSLYREVNSYPRTLAEAVPGSPETHPLHQLFEHARQLVLQWARQERRRWLEQYYELRGKSVKATEELTTIVLGAAEGRVEVLFIAEGAQLWGTVDWQRRAVEVSSTDTPGAVDLVNEAAVQTLLHRGTVLNVAAQELPDAASMAALLRY
jgi:hypothetical protein